MPLTAHRSARLRTFALAGSLALGVTVAGCETAPGLKKRFGSYTEWVSASPDRAVAAARQAFTELDLQPVEQTQSGDTTRLVARNALNTRITVTLKPAGSDSTRIGVKVTPGQSEGYSLSLLRAIQGNL